MCDAAQHGWGAPHEGEVGTCRAEKAPRQEEQGEHAKYPQDESLRTLRLNGGCESGQVQAIKDGQWGADQPEKCVGQVCLPRGRT